MHDILDMVMMRISSQVYTTAMSKKNATIQENYLKSSKKELCMSAAEKLAISIRGLAFKTLILYSNRLLYRNYS